MLWIGAAADYPYRVGGPVKVGLQTTQLQRIKQTQRLFRSALISADISHLYTLLKTTVLGGGGGGGGISVIKGGKPPMEIV